LTNKIECDIIINCTIMDNCVFRIVKLHRNPGNLRDILSKNPAVFGENGDETG
jgi:hypothetical protein